MKITCVYFGGSYVPCWLTGRVKYKTGELEVMIPGLAKNSYYTLWAKEVDIRHWDFNYFTKTHLKKHES